MTEAIGNLALALSKAQAMMKSARKDSENPHFKSRYADLASVWDACREALTKNELAVIQPVLGGPETITIRTILVHKSGESVTSEFTIKPMKPDAQGLGSAITYGRRYALAAMVGIAPDDDDGNAASEPVKTIVTKEQAKKAIQEKADKARIYTLNHGDGEFSDHAGTDAFLTALGRLLKGDDPMTAWECNVDTVMAIREEAEKAKNEQLVGRCKAAQDFANTRVAQLNP